MGTWLSEFFGALPDVVRAVYAFADPQDLGRGWVGGAVALLWLGPLGVVPLYLAKLTYGKHEWVSATMGVMGAASLLWWLHGVLPHAWIQFTESNQPLLEGTVIPATAGIGAEDGYRLDIASDLYSVITESVLAGLMMGGIVVTLWAALRMQRSLPKTLANEETKPEAGGYR